MNSALKPVLPQPGVPQPGGQASPAKANVASANHAVALPQGAQNSLHHGSNNLVGQNLTHHVNAPPVPPHAVPSMAPVTANMAQMAQNMSHHGNLSHVTQNSVPPPSPSKPVSTSAPLSLVQEKANTSQPLALTRTPEKKDPDSSSHANGTIESSKAATNAPTTLKAQNPETNKDKLDIAKTSPSTPKPPENSPEKLSSTQCTPQKIDSPNPLNQIDSPAQPKLATANEAPEKSPTKPSELKPTAPADTAPTQSDNKSVLEPANSSQDKASPSTPQEQESILDSPKPDSPTKPEEKKEEPSEKPPQVEAKKEDAKQTTEPIKEEDQTDKGVKSEEKVEEKKNEVKTTIKAEVKATPKSTMKLATVTPPLRKRRQLSPMKATDGVPSAMKLSDVESTPDTRIKRNRTKVQLYQSPTPEIAMATKLSASAGRSTPTKPNDDKLIVFYKNEYLAVRNAEGGFYVCQAVQNVYRTTRKIKIRWLSQDKTDSSGETYKPDFYDVTDMECVLTTLSLSRAPAGGGAQLLKAAEEARARSILERAIKAEQSGANNLELTEEHPDGLDLSLYTDESQLEKARKRRSSKSSRGKLTDTDTAEEESPVKKCRTSPKRSPPQCLRTSTKRKAVRSPAASAAASKTATAVSEKTKVKTPSKRAASKPVKSDTPVTTPTRKPRRTGKESKPSPIVPTPSTSTGKTTRTPRKPPAKK